MPGCSANCSERTDELAARNSEFGERIEHQSATIDVLKAMSASPGDPQPVFDLIIRRARDLCNAEGGGLFEFDGELVHLRSRAGGTAAYRTPEAQEAYKRLFPMVPMRGSLSCRAILDRQTIHVRDMASEPGVSAAVRNLGYKSQIVLPLLRDGAAIGAVSLTSAEIGGFSDSQVALMQTFAEQAVIAITSAETYRELQQRTGDLQESLEYQTATSDVLKVISGSTFDMQPVFDTIAETAARLCDADYGAIYRRDGEVYRIVTAVAFSPETRRPPASFGHSSNSIRSSPTAGSHYRPGRAGGPGSACRRHPLPTRNTGSAEATTLGKVRTQLGVPLLREGEPIGCHRTGTPAGRAVHRAADRAGAAPSPTRRSSRWRMPGCSASCSSAPTNWPRATANSASASSISPRRSTCSRRCRPRRAIRNRCST